MTLSKELHQEKMLGFSIQLNGTFRRKNILLKVLTKYSSVHPAM